MRREGSAAVVLVIIRERCDMAPEAMRVRAAEDHEGSADGLVRTVGEHLQKQKGAIRAASAAESSVFH